MPSQKSTPLLLLALFAFWTSTLAQPLLEPTPSPEILCNVNELSEICPAIYDPVCVPAPKQCFTTPCYQHDTYSNKCQACNTPGVLSYTPGQCQYGCEPLNLPPPALDKIDDPVCANYQQDCHDSTCRQTFSRSTLACQDPNVVSFSLGACQDDNWEDGNNEEECTLEEECLLEEEECVLEEEFNLAEHQADEIDEITLYCEGARPEICPAIYSPVCVTECLDGECRRTAVNSCNACSDSNTVAYTPGACEVERIQCPVQDLTATEVFCTLEYAPVCGYSSDCTQEPCGTTAGNVCEACTFQGKDYYIRGTCEGTPF